MNLWFLCSHKRTTFPITLPERARKISTAQADNSPRTYMTCLDCGKEIPYSWELMKVLPRRHVQLKQPINQPSSAA